MYECYEGPRKTGSGCPAWSTCGGQTGSSEDALLQPCAGERVGEKRIWGEKWDKSETGPPGRQGELLIPAIMAILGVCMG